MWLNLRKIRKHIIIITKWNKFEGIADNKNGIERNRDNKY